MVKKIIKDSSLIKIGRAANMAWLIFEKGFEQYSLHMQSSFRITYNDEIILASNDMYFYDEEAEKLNSGSDDNNFNSLYDKVAKTIKDLKVETIDIVTFNDIIIKFENNFIFQSFANNSEEIEQWRFLKKGGIHYVATQKQIEIN